MENPWIEKFERVTDFKKVESYVLESEKSVIDQFNRNEKNKDFIIRTDVYPACFSPNLNSAKVILLMANPGYDEAEEPDYRSNDFVKNCISTLLEKQSKKEFVSEYWYKKLKPVVEELNELGFNGKEEIESKIAIVEFFPYHSKKYKPLGKKLIKNHFGQEQYLPSQLWTFNQLKDTFVNDPILICTRNYKSWKTVLEMLGYDFDNSNFLRTNSYLNPTISKKNLGSDKNWELLIRKLTE